MNQKDIINCGLAVYTRLYDQQSKVYKTENGKCYHISMTLPSKFVRDKADSFIKIVTTGVVSMITKIMDQNPKALWTNPVFTALASVDQNLERLNLIALFIHKDSAVLKEIPFEFTITVYIALETPKCSIYVNIKTNQLGLPRDLSCQLV